MITRVTEGMRYSSLTGGIADIQKKYADLTEQLAKQKKVLRPSDDPAAAARISEFGAEKASIEQYGRNVDNTKPWVETTNTVLTEISKMLGQAVRGVDSNLTAEERSLLAENLGNVIDSIASLGNTQYNGRYLLSGSRTQFNAAVAVPVAGSGNTYGGTVSVTADSAYTGPDSKVFAIRAKTAAAQPSGATYEISADGGQTWSNATYSDLTTDPATHHLEGIKLTFSSATAVAQGDLFLVRTIKTPLSAQRAGAAIANHQAGAFDGETSVALGSTYTGRTAHRYGIVFTGATTYSVDGGANQTYDPKQKTITVGDGITLLLKGGTTDPTTGDQFSVTAFPDARIQTPMAGTRNTYAGSISIDPTYSFTQDTNKTYVVKIEGAGALGTATYRVSSDGGKTWGSLATTAATINIGEGTDTVNLSLTAGTFAHGDTVIVHAYADPFYNGNGEALTVETGKGVHSQYNIPGESVFTRQGVKSVDLLGVLRGLQSALETNDTAEIDRQQGRLTDLQTQVLSATSTNGVLGQALDVAKGYSQSLSTTVSNLLSAETEVDLAAVMVELNKEQTALQAAYSVTTRISQQTILNFLSTV